jgi:dephospho-CoA kinase
MLVVGLTGSIASGKSTAAAMFAELGAAVFDADRAVHALYAGKAVPPIAAAFPGTVKDGAVDRAALGTLIAADKAALAKLEAIVHPLVREMEEALRAEAAAAGRRVVVLDIPLLLETGGEARVDAVVVVTAPEAVRKERALRRKGMTAERYATLAARQMPDEEKRRRAHFVIDSTGEYNATRNQVADVMRALAAKAAVR